jgi:hypothetical protein
MGSPGRPDDAEVVVVVVRGKVVVEPKGAPVVVDWTATEVVVVGGALVEVLVATSSPVPHATRTKDNVVARILLLFSLIGLPVAA